MQNQNASAISLDNLKLLGCEPFVHSPIHHLPIYLSIHLSIYLPSIHPPTYPSIHLAIIYTYFKQDNHISSFCKLDALIPVSRAYLEHICSEQTSDAWVTLLWRPVFFVASHILRRSPPPRGILFKYRATSPDSISPTTSLIGFSHLGPLSICPITQGQMPDN